MTTSKAIIYSKQADGPRIPVTVRIEWLPDGTIKPLMYWTPDGYCLKVRHIYESMLLAFIKDKGEGLRIKVRAEVIETPEPYDDRLHAQLETYLYFADSRFCGKNIVDERYGHAGKKYITVILDVFPDNDYELVYFNTQGKRYMVERTVAIEPRGSFLAGGVGIKHIVGVRQVNAGNDGDPDPYNIIRRITAIYFEINKWFVTVTVKILSPG